MTSVDNINSYAHPYPRSLKSPEQDQFRAYTQAPPITSHDVLVPSKQGVPGPPTEEEASTEAELYPGLGSI
jgi:hypothetical protein